MLCLNGWVIRGVAANRLRMGGTQFESEIREQPAVLRRIAASTNADILGAAIGTRDVVFTGSGSSLFVAQLAALAWRASGRRAEAVAASEARFCGAAPPQACVVALSQSGRTGDVLGAVDALSAEITIALTNDLTSPLAERASLAIDVLAGPERAVPASKSVTAMAALLLGAATGSHDLAAAADAIGTWLDGAAAAQMDRAAERLDPVQSIIAIGMGFGVPVADEVALKIKESTYRHAEGFGAGEFLHGSTAILDATRGVIGIVAASDRAVVADVLATARAAQSIVVVFGEALPDESACGPDLTGTFAPLGWIVTGQMLALSLARRAGIDSDTPRGLRKFLT